MKFLEKIFGSQEDPEAEARKAAEAKVHILEEAEGQKASLLTWMRAGEATSQDRELLERLEQRIERLKNEIAQAEQESSREEVEEPEGEPVTVE